MRDIFQDDSLPVSEDPSNTNEDATDCRYSMVKAGLMDDPYIQYFVHSAKYSSPKPPIINRGLCYCNHSNLFYFIGTFLRTASIDKKIKEILDYEPIQVVSLGAGFDTRYYRLCGNKNLLRYVEVDFAHVIQSKRHIIQRHKLDQSPEFVSGDLESEWDSKIFPKITDLVKQDCHTIIIAECCLMYLSNAAKIISEISSKFEKATLICFDPLFVGDKFGHIMKLNLSDRGLSVNDFVRFPSVDHQKERFTGLGWNIIQCMTMFELSQSQDYAQILQQKSPLDEYEEWTIMSQHYYFMVANNFK